MADKGLMDKIRKYVESTNNLGRPTTEEEQKLFSAIMNKDNVFNHTALDLSELRQFANEVKATEVKTCLAFYTEVAREMEITCIDTESNTDGEILIDTELNNEEQTVKNECLIDVEIHFGNDKIAIGKYNKDINKISVLKGSDIRVESGSLLEHIMRIREEYDKDIVDSKLIKSTKFISPSRSAALVFGNSINGWDAWKDRNGIALNSINILLEESSYQQNTEHENKDIKCRQVEKLEAPEVNEDAMDNKEGDAIVDMAPEEMLVKGLTELLKEDRGSTIEIGENTINKLGIKLREVINNSNNKEQDNAVDTALKLTDSTDNYTEEDRNNDVIGIPYSKVKNAVQRGMNVIYRGVPGCGKTYAANCDAKALIGFRKSNRIKQIDFTENLDYSDTMVGLRQSENGRWQYIKGEIAKFCKFAAEFTDEKFVLILNEFTRANTEAVLGQMFTAMENKYRGEDFTLDNGEKFMCPKNLIVLATMNGTDKGVKKLDKATEERFYIIDVKPLWEEWAKVKKDADNEAFFELILMLNIKLDSEEYTILKELCIEMANINKDCEAGGLLTSDSQIGQRQLLQFIGQTDLDNNEIKYDKETLGIIIEQLISRVIPMKDMYSTVEDSVNKLRKLLERCNG